MIIGWCAVVHPSWYLNFIKHYYSLPTVPLKSLYWFDAIIKNASFNIENEATHSADLLICTTQMHEHGAIHESSRYFILHCAMTQTKRHRSHDEKIFSQMQCQTNFWKGFNQQFMNRIYQRRSLDLSLVFDVAIVNFSYYNTNEGMCVLALIPLQSAVTTLYLTLNALKPKF